MRPPVLLIHGAFSCGAHFEPWAGHLSAARYTCHAPTLPGHGPSDPALLARLGLPDFLEAMVALRKTLPQPPVVIGHSMGGLIAQQLAAATECAALVLVASAPPFALPAQLRAIPYLAPMVPRILAGLPLRPSEATLEALALNGLPAPERGALIGTFGQESGRAYRSMILGAVDVATDAIRCPVLCVSGSEDRIISRSVATRTAARYGAEHRLIPEQGHWLIAPSLRSTVLAPIIEWLEQHQRATTSASSGA